MIRCISSPRCLTWVLALSVLLAAHTPESQALFGGKKDGSSKKQATVEQQPFLPPVATINPKMYAGQEAADADDQSLEPVTMAAVGSPHGVVVRNPIAKLDGTISLNQANGMQQALAELQKAVSEDDLNKLWAATVERNPVIHFALEKLATPADLQAKKSSFFMKKTLNTMISGAVIGSTLMPGFGGYYQNMAAFAGGDVLRNLVNGRVQVQSNALSPTEQIQLATMVDELKGKLVQGYYDYKGTLQQLMETKQTNLKNNTLYTQAMENRQDVATMVTGLSYYQGVMKEAELRQKAQMLRLQLERFAGPEVVNTLQLSVAPVTQPEQAKPVPTTGDVKPTDTQQSQEKSANSPETQENAPYEALALTSTMEVAQEEAVDATP
jgi:hypothetical protein